MHRNFCWVRLFRPNRTRRINNENRSTRKHPFRFEVLLIVCKQSFQVTFLQILTRYFGNIISPNIKFAYSFFFQIHTTQTRTNCFDKLSIPIGFKLFVVLYGKTPTASSSVSLNLRGVAHATRKPMIRRYARRKQLSLSHEYAPFMWCGRLVWRVSDVYFVQFLFIIIYIRS